MAAKGMLGDLNPLGDGPCRSLADNGARVRKAATRERDVRAIFLIVFLIVGGLYSVTALRKITMRVTVYTKHRLTLQKPE